jgi:hypothetical protein
MMEWGSVQVVEGQFYCRLTGLDVWAWAVGLGWWAGGCLGLECLTGLDVWAWAVGLGGWAGGCLGLECLTGLDVWAWAVVLGWAGGCLGLGGKPQFRAFLEGRIGASGGASVIADFAALTATVCRGR